MKIKNILIFLGLLIISDVFIYYVHEYSHKYDEPYVAEEEYDFDPPEKDLPF